MGQGQQAEQRYASQEHFKLRVMGVELKTRQPWVWELIQAPEPCLSPEGPLSYKATAI